MKILKIWFLIQLALSTTALFAQDLVESSTATSKILSSFSSQQSKEANIHISIGFMQHTLTAVSTEQNGSKSVSKDTTLSSKDLANAGLKAALRTRPLNPQKFIENRPETDAAVSVFPNPFIERVTLLLDNTISHGADDLRYSLLDSRGHNINSGSLKTTEQEIVMGSLPDGIYFLVLFKNNQEIKTFKLLKTKR